MSLQKLISSTAYVAATDDGQFVISRMGACQDYRSVKLSKAEMRELYGVLRQLDCAGQLED